MNVHPLISCLKVYGCYLTYNRSRMIIMAPMSGLLSLITTGAGSIYTYSLSAHDSNFASASGRWTLAIYFTALYTNVVCSVMLVAKLSAVTRETQRASTISQPNRITPVSKGIRDSAVIYTVVLGATLATTIADWNERHILLDMMTPVISISFYLVIIRPALADIRVSLSGHLAALPSQVIMTTHIPTAEDMEPGQITMSDSACTSADRTDRHSAM